MKCGIQIHCSNNGLHVYMPVRYKMTFYISSVSLICMAVLAAVCIVKSRSDSISLMAERLAQFASIRASQIERDLNDQVVLLDFAMQGSLITTTIMSLYFGNITAFSWAGNLKNIVTDMFSTSIRNYEALVIYDVAGNIIFSMANPDQAPTVIEKLIPVLPSMLPFGNTLYGQNMTLPYNRNSTRENDEVQRAAASAAVAAAKNATSNPKHSSNSPQSLNFPKTVDNISARLSQPAPLVNSSQLIDGYSYSLSVPISYTTIVNKTQVSRLIGYCSAILDCSHYMNYTAVDDINDLREMNIMKKSWISVIGVENDRWHLLFPTGANATADRQFHPFSSFPAVEDDVRLRERLQDDISRKPGGAIMKTKTPRAKKASVGYSYVNAVNRQWYVIVELPRSQAESPIWRLTKLLCAMAISLLVLVTGAAYLLSGMATFPLFHIYRAMELQTRDSSMDVEMSSKHAHKVKDLVIVTPAFNGTEHFNFSRYSSTTFPESLQPSPSIKSPSLYIKQASKVQSHGSLQSFSSKGTYESPSSRMISEKTVKTVTNGAKELKETHGGSNYRVPRKVPPLNRPITDEFDDLVTEYNNMVDDLTIQYTKMEDEVRERTKEAQESKEHAEAANEAKTKFLMNISHELITPMNGIVGIAAIAEEETVIVNVRRSLRTIIESSRLLQELLEAILNYNSYLAGVETKLERFVLGTLITDLKDTFEDQSNANGIALNISCYPSCLEDCCLEGAIEPILRICTGLVSNALKFSNPKKMDFADASPPPLSPSVAIHAYLHEPDSLVDISGLPGDKTSNAMLEIVIADTGIGIGRDQLGTVFDEFVQGEDALSKRFTGAGLGLAMSKLLCDRIGGYIVVYSGEKVGSTAVLRVPINNVLGFKVDSTPRQLRPEFYRSNSPVWWTDSKRRHIFYEPGKASISQNAGQVISESTVISRGLNKTSSNDTNTSFVSSLSDCLNGDPCHTSDTSIGYTKVKTGVLAVELAASQYSQHSQHSQFTSASQEIAGIDAESNAGSQTSQTFDIQEEVSRLQILVADDNQVMREILQKMLYKLGVRHVDVAEDGPSVINMVEKAIVSGTQYSIIFMDLSMPTTNGIKATQDIRRQLGYFCPVVALTGYSDKATTSECLKAGLQKVLTKPVEKHQLMDTLRLLVLNKTVSVESDVKKPEIAE